MTEGVKPSASEEARAAAIAAENKKTKQTQNLAGQYGSKALGANQGKKLQTSFDDILKHASDGDAANALTGEDKFDSRLKQITQDEDRGGSSSDQDKEEDSKPSDKGEGSKKTKDTSLAGRERIVGKHSSGEGQQDSGGGGGGGKREGGGSQRGFQKEMSTNQFAAADLKRREMVPAPVPMEAAKIQPTTITPPESAEAPRELPKALLDQIVQCVTIKRNSELNKEIQIDFNDNIFNGLKLKLTAQGKEISVEFMVPNRAVEDCFKRERENLALALGEKGIDVRSINVTRQ